MTLRETWKTDNVKIIQYFRDDELKYFEPVSMSEYVKVNERKGRRRPYLRRSEVVRVFYGIL